jgi:hypothetical protein
VGDLGRLFEEVLAAAHGGIEQSDAGRV